MRKELRFVIRGESSRVNRHLCVMHEVRERGVQFHLPHLSSRAVVGAISDFLSTQFCSFRQPWTFYIKIFFNWRVLASSAQPS